MPAPDGEQNSSEEECCEDDDFACCIDEDEISATFSDWISELQRRNKQKIAMMVYDNYIKRFGLLRQGLLQKLGLLLGLSDRTVRLWRKDFLTNDGDFSKDGQGKYERFLVQSVIRHLDYPN